MIVLPLFVIELVQYLRNDQDVLLRLPRPVQAGFAVVLFMCIAILGNSYGRQFIYFQF